jgi:hypothetical protein
MISVVAQKAWFLDRTPILMKSVTQRIGLNTRFDKWCVIVLVMAKERIVIGPVEYVKVIGHNGEARVKGKIDTGATRTSVDVWLAANIGLGPTVDVAKVKSALDEVRSRPLVRGIVEIAGEEFALAVSVDDRSDMRYPVLIGMDILRLGRFLIDPTKKTPAKYRGTREGIERKYRAHI